MEMHNPPHPGAVLKELYLEPLGLTVTGAAKGLGITRKTLSAIVNHHAGISPEMAMRLSKAFGGTAKSWLNMQRDYDLWQAKAHADLSAVQVLIPVGETRGPEDPRAPQA
jgi:addiction module HigA family antidote